MHVRHARVYEKLFPRVLQWYKNYRAFIPDESMAKAL
jgi:hypothetical protein